MSSRRRRAVIGVAALVLVAIVVVIIVLTTRGSDHTVAVTRGTLAATIQTDGELVSRDPATVYSPAPGQVSLVAVQPGDTVKAGDVLVELDQKPFQDAIQRAQQQLSIAENAVYIAEEQGGQNPSPQQLAQRIEAQQNLRAAQQQLADAQRALVSSLIQAPTDGTVLSVSVADRAPVTQGMQVAQIADLNAMDLQIDLDEVDLPHVSPGMAVSFTLDAYPGQEIDGTISRISPAAQTSGGTTTFQGIVTFTLPKDLVLRPAMNANVSIKTQVRQGVLLIPESALRTVGTRTFVTVVADGSEQEREIQIGLRSNGMVEVASGLSEGDRVVIH